MPQLTRPVEQLRPVLLATRRAQPTAVFITRLTVTAVVAYLIAWALPIAERPVLAPLTALLVVRYTLYQTILSALARILSVVAGVAVAVLVAAELGFTWWSLGLVIAISLIIGYAARLGDHILEVPISAMLIFALGAYSATGALARIVETLIGASTGLLAGIIAPPVHVRPAQEAIAELGGRMGELLDRLADTIAEGHDDDETFSRLLNRARRLGNDIRHTDNALSQAEESMRLNPRAATLLPMGIALRSGLETLELTSPTVRGLVRSLADRRHLPAAGGVYESEMRVRLAAVLHEVAAAVRAFALLVRAETIEDVHCRADDLHRRLAEGRRLRDEFADALPPWTSARSAEWRLHAETLVHIDRLLDLFGSASDTQRRERRGRRRFPRPSGRLRRSHRLRRRRRRGGSRGGEHSGGG